MNMDLGLFGILGGAWFILQLVFYVVICGITLTLYILYSIGFMKIAQRLRFPNPWLAWIPFGNLYLKGQMVPEISLAGNKLQRMELMLPIICGALNLIGFAMYFIPFVGFLFYIIFSAASWALTAFVSHKIIRCFDPARAMVLSIFYHIGFFVIKDKPAAAPTPVYVPRPAAQTYGYGQQPQQGYAPPVQPQPQQQYTAPQQYAPQPPQAQPAPAPQPPSAPPSDSVQQ